MENIMDNVEYRNLEYDDVPALNALIDKSKSYLGLELSDTLLKNLKQSALKLLLDPNNQMVGAFEDGILIYAVSGYFPKNQKTWILHGMYSSTPGNGLKTFIKYFLHLDKTTRILVNYGELNGYYSFLARRPIKHQLATQKLLKRFTGKYDLWTPRYNSVWEQVLTKDTKPEEIKYTFWKMLDTPVDTVIVRWTLKDEYRKEL
jgi:hypothetical protein